MGNYYVILSNEAHRSGRTFGVGGGRFNMKWATEKPMSKQWIQLNCIRFRFEIVFMKQYLLLMDSNVLTMTMIRDIIFKRLIGKCTVKNGLMNRANKANVPLAMTHLNTLKFRYFVAFSRSSAIDRQIHFIHTLIENNWYAVTVSQCGVLHFIYQLYV